MSSFNTINFKCPNCGKSISIQSKSGDCTFKEYFCKSVPIADVSEIINKVMSCPHCQRTLVVKTNTTRVAMFLSDERYD